MPFDNFHIAQGNPSYKLWIFNILSLGIVAYVTKKLLSARYWKTRIVVKLNKILGEIYVISEGLKVVVKDFDKEKAAQEHNKAKKVLLNYRSLISKLEKVDFFKNQETKTISENTLSNFYSIEAHIRMLAFSDKPVIPEDESLTEFASRLSLGSLQA